MINIHIKYKIKHVKVHGAGVQITKLPYLITTIELNKNKNLKILPGEGNRIPTILQVLLLLAKFFLLKTRNI